LTVYAHPFAYRWSLHFVTSLVFDVVPEHLEDRWFIVTPGNDGELKISCVHATDAQLEAAKTFLSVELEYMVSSLILD
jgi:hypothetical protein